VVLQRSEGGPLELSLTRRSGRASTPPPPVFFADAAPAELAADSGTDVIPIAHFRELEKKNIVAALEKCAWKIAGDQGAARLLGMKPSTLAYQMKTLGIERAALRNP
jgi:transcriptional regulator with GAF, ATPase, and Fis domain